MGLIPNRKTYDQSQHHLTMKSTRVLTTMLLAPLAVLCLLALPVVAADAPAVLNEMRMLHQQRKWTEFMQRYASESFATWAPEAAREALQIRGQIYSFTKDGKHAEADLQAALRLAPHGTDIMLLLADNYVNNLNDDAKAISAYQQALAITGTNQGWQPLTATVGLARLYTDQVKLDAALEVLKPYGDLSQLPNTWRIKLLRAYGHIYAAQGKEPESLAKFREALRLESQP